jgi:hypothetical protein
MATRFARRLRGPAAANPHHEPNFGRHASLVSDGIADIPALADSVRRTNHVAIGHTVTFGATTHADGSAADSLTNADPTAFWARMATDRWVRA